jgi:hypothetical protein
MFSMILNLTRPDHHPHSERRDGNPHHPAHVGRELQSQCDAADLGGQSHQVDEERGSQIGRGGARAQALSDDLECGATTDRGDAAGHLGEQADADHTDDHDPGQ